MPSIRAGCAGPDAAASPASKENPRTLAHRTASLPAEALQHAVPQRNLLQYTPGTRPAQTLRLLCLKALDLIGGDGKARWLG